MNAGLLAKYFGTDRRWRGPCIVVLDADATIQTTGTDTIDLRLGLDIKVVQALLDKWA